jgi:hypothetical protein
LLERPFVANGDRVRRNAEQGGDLLVRPMLHEPESHNVPLVLGEARETISQLQEYATARGMIVLERNN